MNAIWHAPSALARRCVSPGKTGLRARILLALTGFGVAAFLIAAALLLDQASREQQAVATRAAQSAARISHALDRAIVRLKPLPGGPAAAIGDADLVSLLDSLTLVEAGNAIVLDQDFRAIAEFGGDQPKLAGLSQPHWSLASTRRPSDRRPKNDNTPDVAGHARSDLTGWTVLSLTPTNGFAGTFATPLVKLLLFGSLLALLGTATGAYLLAAAERPATLLTASIKKTESRLRLALDSLRRAEARYDHFWRFTPESMFAVRVGNDGRFTFDGINPAHERLTGLRQSDVAGFDPQECLPNDVAASVLARYRECVSAGEPIVYDETLDLPGGKRHWRTSLAPVRDPASRRIRLILGSARDMTADRAARETIERGRRLLQRIVAASPDVIFVFDVIAGCNTFIGGHVDAVLGHPAASIERADTSRMREFVHPDDLDRVNAHLLELSSLPDDAVASLEYRARRADGSFRWLRSKVTVFLRTADGRVAEVAGVLTDIDQVKRTEADLVAGNVRLRSILASISDCYYTIDRRYRITDINPVALDWLGAGRHDIVGRSCHDVFAMSAECAEAIALSIARQQARTFEARSTLYPGKWLDCHIYPSPDGASVFFRDITKRKEAERSALSSKALLQSSLDALAAPMVMLDSTGRILTANRAWDVFANAHGASGSAGGCGQPFLVICGPPHVSSGDAKIVSENLSALIAGETDNIRVTYLLTLHGRPRWIQLRAARFSHDDGIRIVVTHEDITDAWEAKLAVSDLSDQLLAVQEVERQRIAQDLHDSTAQHLVAMELLMMSVRSKTQPGGDTENLWAQIDHSLSEATKELRAFTYLLHPPHLESERFDMILEQFLAGFSARTGLDTRLDTRLEINQLPLPLKRTLLRIVQEALANAHRHAAAKQVLVSLRATSGQVLLVVSDDGKGIPRSRLVGTPGRIGQMGVGIPGMQSRLRQFGGTLEIESGSAGTTIRAGIPLDGQMHETKGPNSPPSAAHPGKLLISSRPRGRPEMLH